MSPNRESLRELARQQASVALDENRSRQHARVHKRRKSLRTFQRDDLVFVRKSSQATRKLDSGARGPYRITKILPCGRYELKLVAGSYGKTTQAAAEYMILWKGEWTLDVCAALFENDDNADESNLSLKHSSSVAQSQTVRVEVHAAENIENLSDGPASSNTGEVAPSSGKAELTQNK